MRYTNPPLDIPELVAMLKSRGLMVADEYKARKFLEDVSYFRFATYLRPMEQDTASHTYKSTASFETAVKLYEFDSSLRQLIFSAVQKI